MADQGSCIKFLVTEAGEESAVRVYTGPNYDSMTYSGSIVVATTLLGKMLDCLVYGAGDLTFSGGFQVFYGPDEELGAA